MLRRDLAWRTCSIAARGLWMEIVCAMHDADYYGHLAINGNPLSSSECAIAFGVPLGQFRRLLAELERKRVMQRTERGVLYSVHLVQGGR